MDPCGPREMDGRCDMTRTERRMALRVVALVCVEGVLLGGWILNDALGGG